MAGIGLDAHIVYNVSGALKARPGKLAYWVAGWRLLGRRLPTFQVEIEGRTRPCSFALMSKVRNYGGDFEIARSVSLFDDEFEVVLFEGRSSAGLCEVPRWEWRLNRLSGMKGVTVLRADRMNCIQSGGQPYLRPGGWRARWDICRPKIRIVPDALTLLVPPNYKPRLKAVGT